ncbi:hypothetical protein cypCar_00049430 [Cyprinus carpio]|nr:hypothetical protein cypCar_00049430 [Cyprinus carpio]
MIRSSGGLDKSSLLKST